MTLTTKIAIGWLATLLSGLLIWGFTFDWVITTVALLLLSGFAAYAKILHHFVNKY